MNWFGRLRIGYNKLNELVWQATHGHNKLNELVCTSSRDDGILHRCDRIDSVVRRERVEEEDLSIVKKCFASSLIFIYSSKSNTPLASQFVDHFLIAKMTVVTR